VAEPVGSAELTELGAGLGAALESLSGALDEPEFGYLAVRKRYFDNRLTPALGGGGVRQVVSLTADLHGRAMRL
jgi:O-methyltransferase involved in polyketide biosynthesis